MKLELSKNGCILTVTKEPGDPRFKRSGWALPESTFLYHVKKVLLDAGFDVIKKRMWKDGHMVDDLQQYVRTRKKDAYVSFWIYNGGWQIEDAGEAFNERGEVHLSIDFDIHGKGGNGRGLTEQFRAILEAYNG